MIIALCGPSGSGKTAIIDSILANQELGYKYNVGTFRTMRSCTTKNSRLDDYTRVSLEEFNKMIENDEFVEYSCYSGEWYGLPKSEVVKCQNPNIVGIKAFDINGVNSLHTQYGNEVVSVFVNRDIMNIVNTISERDVTSDEKERRISQLSGEFLNKDKCDEVLDVIEGDISGTVDELIKIVEKHLAR